MRDSTLRNQKHESRSVWRQFFPMLSWQPYSMHSKARTGLQYNSMVYHSPSGNATNGRCRKDLEQTQPTKIKVVGTFHVPSTKNPGKSWTADGTAERACYFCRLSLCRLCLNKIHYPQNRRSRGTRNSSALHASGRKHPKPCISTIIFTRVFLADRRQSWTKTNDTS